MAEIDIDFSLGDSFVWITLQTNGWFLGESHCRKNNSSALKQGQQMPKLLKRYRENSGPLIFWTAANNLKIILCVLSSAETCWRQSIIVKFIRCICIRACVSVFLSVMDLVLISASFHIKIHCKFFGTCCETILVWWAVIESLWWMLTNGVIWFNNQVNTLLQHFIP